MSKAGQKQAVIRCTTDYSQFVRSADNRPTDMRRHKRLVDSMRKYGFIKTLPVVCVRDQAGRLVVKDGQHRLEVAISLGLPVWWVEADEDFDIATVNSAAKGWSLRDYAAKWAAAGKGDYKAGLEFSAKHRMPLGMSFAILAGTTSFGNLGDSFYDGTFRVKDSAWAEAVAVVYSSCGAMSKQVSNARFLDACMAMCRVPGFDVERFVKAAGQNRDKLVSYSTRDAYLGVCEDIYNHHKRRDNQVPLKFEAIKAMRSRNAVLRSKGE